MKSAFAFPSPGVALATFLLLLLNGWLLLDIWTDLQSSSSEKPVTDTLNGQREIQLLDIGQLASRAPLETSEAALKRPLFYSSRQPYEVPQPQAEAAEVSVSVADEPPPTYRLYGVVIDDSDSKALLQTDSAAGPEWMTIGQMQEGWRLTFVGPNAVTLEKAGRRLSVELYPSP